MNPPLALAMLALGHVGRPPALAHPHDLRRPPSPVGATAPSRPPETGVTRPEIQREIADLAERFLRDRK